MDDPLMAAARADRVTVPRVATSASAARPAAGSLRAEWETDPGVSG
jgi:hypothetical protein